MTKAEVAVIKKYCEDFESDDWKRIVTAELNLKLVDVVPAFITVRERLVEALKPFAEAADGLSEISDFERATEQAQAILRELGELE